MFTPKGLRCRTMAVRFLMGVASADLLCCWVFMVLMTCDLVAATDASLSVEMVTVVISSAASWPLPINSTSPVVAWLIVIASPRVELSSLPSLCIWNARHWRAVPVHMSTHA